MTTSSPNLSSTAKELQFPGEHHLDQQQQGGGAGDECSSESCLSDQPSPDWMLYEDEPPEDPETYIAECEAGAKALAELCGKIKRVSRPASPPGQEKTGPHREAKFKLERQFIVE
ncbi:hypothetical protein GJAV_G00170220 [Gymnothorax javanicus]|nr:hypothetical protein GJAV_G00170220 [Gymnothorax javanicus]